MSWKKHFKPVTIDGHGSHSPISGGGRPGPAKTNYSSFLPDVYAGTPNRIDRYMQYDTMDMDSEVNAALDIIAEFCTQKDKENETPFHTSFRGQPTSTEVKLIKDCLQKWCKQQQFETRIFRIIRNTFKYGDCFFLRDPETKKWLYVDPVKVSKIIANESEGKIPEQYVIKDINFNFKNLIAVTPHGITNTSPSGTASYTSGGSLARGMVGDTARSTGTRFQNAINEIAVDAKNVVHISLSEGLDNNFPFGNSLLESVFKVYKQKELLEDAVIIYRVQRAPERRIFYVDVGNMPAHMAMGFVERVKNEIQQRRIPSATGGSPNFNSVDSSYNPMCIDLTTRIPLLDGRTLELSEIIEEFEAGRENWVYSCNPETGKIVPGIINWAGDTRKDAEVIKLTFDNGKTLTCTPDHKIPVFGKGFVEAQNIELTDSLIAFNTQNAKISNKSNDYQQVWDHELKKWQWTHRLVGEFFRKQDKHSEFTYLTEYADAEKAVIHHIDCDRYNNDPRNLTYMNKADHVLFHASQKKEFWDNMTPEYREEMTGKISNTLKDYWANLPEEEKEKGRQNILEAQKKAVWMRQNDPATKAQYHTNMSAAQKKRFENDPESLERLIDQANSIRKPWRNQSLTVTFEMLQIVADIVKSGVTMKKDVIAICDGRNDLLELVVTANSNWNDDVTQNKIDFTRFGYSKIDRLMEVFGYKDWKYFVKEIDNFNHKVVKIERVGSMDVGTITVDGLEEWHDYHTFAIESGLFIKNSTNEDFFLPKTSEGRGSSIETLPGGQSLGEITDLRFFTNKLFRALRIPASYLPTGIEEASNTVADGKVGTAYIQEFRFNEYCKRLQNLLVQTFDLEFKLWLYSQGINIDSSLFELKFNEPQNFAAYRQSELDTTRVNIFAQLQEIPYLSKRFAMKRFLGMTQEEITENEAMWREENGHKLESLVDGAGELRSAGISPSGIASDMSSQDEQAPEGVGQGPEGAAGGIGSAPGPMGNAAPGPTGGPMGM